jgi:hypothetical protein
MNGSLTDDFRTFNKDSHYPLIDVLIFHQCTLYHMYSKEHCMLTQSGDIVSLDEI